MATFDTRRNLTRQDLLPIVGAGVGVGLGTGLIAAYVTRLFVMRRRIRGGRSAEVRVVRASRPVSG